MNNEQVVAKQAEQAKLNRGESVVIQRDATTLLNEELAELRTQHKSLGERHYALLQALESLADEMDARSEKARKESAENMDKFKRGESSGNCGVTVTTEGCWVPAEEEFARRLRALLPTVSR